MFEDSLIESGGRLKSEAGPDHYYFLHFSDGADWDHGPDSAALYGSLAQDRS